MDIRNIYEALANKGKILSKSEILEVIREYSKKFRKINAENTIKYLSRHNYTKRIFLEFYYINSYDEKKQKICKYEDKELLFLVLDKLKIKWYLGLNSAFYTQGKTWQTPNLLNIINNKLSGYKKILGLNIRFFKIKDNLIFGLKKAETKNKVPYFYSDPAKTYLDKVYFRQTKNLIRIKNTNNYLKRYPKWVGKK